MTTESTSLLRHRLLNGWPLFWLLSLPLSGFMVFEMSRTDLASAPGVSHMIGYSVRFAVPLIFAVIAASSMRVLFPNRFTTWWLRNRKQLGLCFAVAMAWQGLFIYWMSGFHREYYFDEIFYLRDELEGSTGYLFLAAMVVTSFNVGRRWLDNRQWRLLHTAGVYFLWAYPFSVYWWNLSYYPDPQPYDHVFYWLGFTAVAVRVLAWGKKRQQRSKHADPDASVSALNRSAGASIALLAMGAAATGRYWQAPVTDTLTLPAWSANLELWLPFWPLEPFLPLLMLWAATALWTRTRGGSPATMPAAASSR